MTEGLLRRVGAFRKRFQLEPLHHLRWSPSPRGEALGMGKFEVEMGAVWEVEPLHRLAAIPLP